MKPKKFDAIDPWPLIIPRATFYQSPCKRACNPFASALADVFGIEEAHA
jgi:hypothetical protein